MIQIDEAASADILRALVALVNDNVTLREQGRQMALAIKELRDESSQGEEDPGGRQEARQGQGVLNG